MNKEKVSEDSVEWTDHENNEASKGEYTLSEEDKLAMDEGYKALNEAHEEATKHNNEILQQIESIRGKGYKEAVVEILKHCEVGGMWPSKWQIADNPSGDIIDDEEWKPVQRYWVDQSTYGMEPDSYHGYIYIEIEENRYLKCYYSM